MNITATDFRKDLFRVLESALEGENIDVAYKGRVLRIRPEKKQPASTRLQRLTAKPFLSGDSSNPLEDMHEMSKELDAEWETAWDERLK